MSWKQHDSRIGVRLETEVLLKFFVPLSIRD